jgi:hypothetical protein
MNIKKCVSGVASATLATLILVGPSWAEDARPPGPAPAKAPGSPALPHHVTGEIVSVNKSAKLFTLKTSEGATMILAADGRVKVTYKNSRGQSIATKITPA